MHIKNHLDESKINWMYQRSLGCIKSLYGVSKIIKGVKKVKCLKFNFISKIRDFLVLFLYRAKRGTKQKFYFLSQHIYIVGV